MRRLWMAVLLPLALAPLPAADAAEVPRLLADINTQAPSALDSDLDLLSGFFSQGNRTLFSTVQGINGDEGILWSTDGTASGTWAVSSTICPSFCGGITPVGTWRGTTFLNVASGAQYAPQLWRTDGTAAGTFPLIAPSPDDPYFAPDAIYALSDRVFVFVVGRQGHALLYRSDGTRAGTVPFTDPDSATFDDIHKLTVWHDRLVFIASGGLWSTDGTAEGTVRLADVTEFYEMEGPVVPTSSLLFFGAGERGEDLWVTDGTPGGARRLIDFPPLHLCGGDDNCDSPDINSLAAEGDDVFFVTSRPGEGGKVWRSDGTESGTRAVLELPFPLYLWSVPRRIAGGRWLFVVSPMYQPAALWTADADFTHAAPLTGCGGGACPRFGGSISTFPGLFIGVDDAHGEEIWITDGTAAGTRLLADICPGPCSSSGDRFPYSMKTAVGTVAGKTYFLAFPHPENAVSPDYELWATDGTPGGTHRVGGHVDGDVGAMGDLALFGVTGPDLDVTELWASDGSPAGTRRVTVLQRSAGGSNPLFVPRGKGALLQVYNGTHNALWRSDGTPAGTIPLAELSHNRSFESYDVHDVIQVGDLQFFQVLRGAAQEEIWRTDGSAAGTGKVILLGRDVTAALLTSWHGNLLFQVQEPGTCAFWSSDGTPGGTRELLPQLPGLRCPTAVQTLGAKFLFVARVETGRGPVPQIFLSDGTAAGTRQISQIQGSRPAFDDNPVMLGGVTFFRLGSPDGSHTEVWRTDGTRAGTRHTFDLFPGSSLFGFRDFLYFTASPAAGAPRGLYRVPAAGGDPVLLTEVASTDQDFQPMDLTAAGDRLFFVKRDLESGSELWVTDGTAAGTRRVRDIRPGADSSEPSDLAAAGNRVFFAAEDGEHGRELWVSDGTEAGTRMAWDLNPGGFSSSPTNLVVNGEILFFSANDGQTGQEPWIMNLEP